MKAMDTEGGFQAMKQLGKLPILKAETGRNPLRK